VRVIAQLRWDDQLAEQLRQAGWHVHDSDFGRMTAVGEVADAAEAAQHLPAGLPVRHAAGEFVVGGGAVDPSVLPPEITEDQMRERWIDDPDVRVWSREINEEIRRGLSDVKRLCDTGDTSAARTALRALRQRLTAVIAEAEADTRPATDKMVRSLRRIADSARRLDDELAIDS
jgi:hypothetical protein